MVINGARQTGKSTLAEQCLRGSSDVTKRYLDDVRTRTSAAADPAAFPDVPGTMMIDEVQRVPTCGCRSNMPLIATHGPAISYPPYRTPTTRPVLQFLPRRHHETRRASGR
ncbi:AAA family ATPase [Nocardia mangyaensis]|uniref:AAA family ATPase n=1 Tax=Nocardia mangyaensis TaxID=2213200 RepID=UPI00197E87FE|nr:AAA family ATPase [Nocardia mangyaensis]